MVLEKIVTFAILYSLTPTPLLSSNDFNKKAYEFITNSKVIVDKTFLSNALKEQVEACYAKEVIYSESKDVINPENALGKSDIRYAEIKPGGELTLKMERPFSVLKFGGISGRVDSSIITKEECDYSVAVLVPTEERQGKIEYAWRWLLPSSVPGGLYNPTAGQVKVDELKIRNNDTKDLYIDAVVGY